MYTLNSDIENLSEKEKKILNAACKIFSEKGFSAATTNEIAKEAGIAEGTIFRYFRTKKDILRGLFIQIANLVADKIALPPIERILLDKTQKDAREIIRELVVDRIKLVDHYFPMFKVMMSEVLFHDDIRSILVEKIINRVLPALDDFYLRKVEEGQFRPIKTHVVLRAFVGNIMMLIAQKNVFGNKLPVYDLDEEIESLIDILLFGISSDAK
ncbi:MAG: TetR/AcrR family transcriptional regulator [Clostridia bacterium]